MRIVAIAFAGALLSAAACQSTPTTAPDSPEAAPVAHASGTGQALSLKQTTPIESDTATLQVGGLGCPLCANNIENKLSGMQGVQDVSVDLAKGLVTVRLWGRNRPSPAALAKAIKDSGFTPTSIQAP